MKLGHIWDTNATSNKNYGQNILKIQNMITYITVALVNPRKSTYRTCYRKVLLYIESQINRSPLLAKNC